ncbi:hypothetical protein ACVWXO_007301 [Bradyrhizobium sp. LM2.7]
MNRMAQHERKKAEAFLVKKTGITPSGAARLSDLELAKSILATSGSRSGSNPNAIKIAARKLELECEVRRAREARQW